MTLPREVAHSLYLMALFALTSGSLVGLGLLAVRLLG